MANARWYRVVFFIMTKKREKTGPILVLDEADLAVDENDRGPDIEDLVPQQHVFMPWVTRDGKSLQLTPRQHRFVVEYMKDLNSNAAARRAGYKQVRGVNNNPIYHPEVQEAIIDELQWQNQSLRINNHRTLSEIATIATMSPKDMAVYVKHGVKVSLRDKVQANELLMKHAGLFAADHKKEITISLSDLIKESYQVKARPVTKVIKVTEAVTEPVTGEDHHDMEDTAE